MPQDTCTAQLKIGKCLQTVLLKNKKLKFRLRVVFRLVRKEKTVAWNPEGQKRARFSSPAVRAVIIFRGFLSRYKRQATRKDR